MLASSRAGPVSSRRRQKAGADLNCLREVAKLQKAEMGHDVRIWRTGQGLPFYVAWLSASLGDRRQPDDAHVQAPEQSPQTGTESLQLATVNCIMITRAAWKAYSHASWVRIRKIGVVK